MSDKEKIKEEIKRRISNLEQIGDRKEIEIHFPEQFKFVEMYEGLLRFIDSLPEEEPTVKGITWKDVNTLDTLINQVRYEFPNGISEKSFGLAVLEKFQDYQNQDDIEEQPVNEDLEEEISKWRNHYISVLDNNLRIDLIDIEVTAKHFAHWQHGKDFDDLLQSGMEFPKEYYAKGKADAMQDFLEKAEIYLKTRVYYNMHPNNITTAIQEFKNYMQNE